MTYQPGIYRAQGANELHFKDNALLYLGTSDDVSIKWDATNLLILPVADDTGILKVGNGTLDMDLRVTLGAAGDYVECDVGAKALEVVGDVRIDLSGATIAAGNTDGGVIKAGTSSAPVTEDTANMKFVSLYFDDGATSGEAVGIYDRLYVTGAGGEGIALRAFGSVTDVAAGNARGAHISLSFGASGTVTGLGAALETTLHMPSGGGMAGTNTSLKVAINSDGTNADPAGATEISFVRIEAQGTQGGIDDLEDDGYFFSFQGFTADADASHMLSSTSLAELPTGTVGLRCKVGSTIYYLPLVAQTQWN